MGKIINNGIVYGGGSSVELDATLSIEGKAADAQAVGKALGIEITQAEYDALSEEEKNNGTYWVTDGAGGAGGAINIELDTTLTIEGKAADAKAVGDAITARYNSEEGCLEVKVGNEWQSTDVSSNVVDEPTDIENITPVLTNYTSVEGQCVYSEALSDDYLPWKAFDGNDNSYGGCVGAVESFLGFQWVDEVYINSVNLTMAYTHSDDNTLKIKMQYFDGIDWLDVKDSEFEQSFTGGAWQDFDFQFVIKKKVHGIRLYTKSTVNKVYTLFVGKMEIYGTKNFNYSSTRNVVYYNKETDFFEVKKDGEFSPTRIRAGFNKLYLYENGDSHTEIGGAWKSYSIKPSYHSDGGAGTTKVMNFQLNENCMIIPEIGAGYLSSLFKENPIDLTGYDKLYVDWTLDWNTATSGSGRITIMVANSINDNYTAVAELAKFWANTDETERAFLDISALNGEYYIGFYKTDYVKFGVGTVRQIWLE